MGDVVPMLRAPTAHNQYGPKMAVMLAYEVVARELDQTVLIFRRKIRKQYVSDRAKRP